FDADDLPAVVRLDGEGENAHRPALDEVVCAVRLARHAVDGDFEGVAARRPVAAGVLTRTEEIDDGRGLVALDRCELDDDLSIAPHRRRRLRLIDLDLGCQERADGSVLAGDELSRIDFWMPI